MDEGLDVGADSEDEDFFWIYAADLDNYFGEESITHNLANFIAVRNSMSERKARGFFMPATEDKGSNGKKGRGLSGAKGFHKGKVNGNIRVKGRSWRDEHRKEKAW